MEVLKVGYSIKSKGWSNKEGVLLVKPADKKKKYYIINNNHRLYGYSQKYIFIKIRWALQQIDNIQNIEGFKKNSDGEIIIPCEVLKEETPSIILYKLAKLENIKNEEVKINFYLFLFF